MNKKQRCTLRDLVAGAVVFFLGIAASRAEIRFADVSAQAGVVDRGESVGAAWADVNTDGLPDIWLDKHQYTPTVIYINKGDGTFSEFIEAFDEEWGLLPTFEGRTDSHGRAWADFDNDGDDDVLEVSDLAWANLFWMNDGAGRFEDIMARAGFEYPLDSAICTEIGNCNPWGRRMPLWFDYDRDGALDVMVAAIVDYDEPYSPTAIFKQSEAEDGSLTFSYSHETGVTYALSAFCRYGLLGELSGDDKD